MRTLFRAFVLLLLVVLVVVLGWYLLAGRLQTPGPGPEEPGEVPQSQPADCPDVMAVAIPGTWESSSTDDPFNPTAVPNALLQQVTQPLEQQYPADRLEVYTVPYVAQFSNPIALPPDGQQSYNNSRSEGTARTIDIITQTHTRCPLTKYALVGFSQGAVIAGDVAARIGAGDGPVSADLVLGATLIADGRRVADAGIPVNPGIGGVGAEVALGGLDLPGITMTGARPGGFGALNDRVHEICDPTDLICAAPPEALSLQNIGGSLSTLVAAIGNPAHALYGSFAVDDAGTTATQWASRWVAEQTDATPEAPHS